MTLQFYDWIGLSLGADQVFERSNLKKNNNYSKK